MNMAHDYDDSPSRIDETVAPEEIEALLASDLRSFGRDTSKVEHLLTRLGVTFARYRQQIQGLHREVQSANLSRAQAGAASTLSPLDAVRYLTPEQLAGVVDAFSRAQIESASRDRHEASAAKATVVRLLNELKLVVSGLSEDPNMPTIARTKLENVLRDLSAKSRDELGELFDLGG